MQHKIKWCYLCKAKENLTKDHIPPENLFPKPRPGNLITVPCCRPCNDSYSKLDEQFRAFITSQVNVSITGKEMMRQKVVGSSFKRSPALRKQMGKGVFMGTATTPTGPMEVPIITVDQNLFAPFFVRLTKGLLATFYPKVDYFAFNFIVTQLHQFGSDHPSFPAHISMLTPDQRGNGVFRFWRGLAHEGNQIAGLWVYQFYDAGLFQVTHGVPEPDALSLHTSS
jgi:hypothetical protein